MKNIAIIGLLLFIIYSIGYPQHHEEHIAIEQDTHLFMRHRVGIGGGYTLVPDGSDDPNGTK